jgi:hypothetical protein
MSSTPTFADYYGREYIKVAYRIAADETISEHFDFVSKLPFSYDMSLDNPDQRRLRRQMMTDNIPPDWATIAELAFAWLESHALTLASIVALVPPNGTEELDRRVDIALSAISFEEDGYKTICQVEIDACRARFAYNGPIITWRVLLDPLRVLEDHDLEKYLNTEELQRVEPHLAYIKLEAQDLIPAFNAILDS